MQCALGEQARAVHKPQLFYVAIHAIGYINSAIQTTKWTHSTHTLNCEGIMYRYFCVSNLRGVKLHWSPLFWSPHFRGSQNTHLVPHISRGQTCRGSRRRTPRFGWGDRALRSGRWTCKEPCDIAGPSRTPCYRETTRTRWTEDTPSYTVAQERRGREGGYSIAHPIQTFIS